MATEREEQMKEALIRHDKLFEKLDEAMATPERIALDVKIIGSFFSGLHITETEDDIVERAVKRIKQVPSSLIPGLEEAEKIIDARLRTAKACNYNDSYKAALDDAIVFIRAELERQRHPETASRTTTAEFNPDREKPFL